MHHLRKRRKYLVTGLLLLSITLFVALAPFAIQAQQDPGPLPGVGQEGIRQAAAIPKQAGLVLTGTDPRIILAKIIRVALSFLGIVDLIIILYAGYLWMMSAGNEETIVKARKIIFNATVGLAIILSALGIVQFIFSSLLRATEEPAAPAPLAAAARVGGGALGSGIIESHYPVRDAIGVARNTRIIITFKEPIDPASLATTAAQDAQGRPKFFDALDDDHDGTIDRRVAVPDLTLRTDALQIITTEHISGSVRESEAKYYLGSTDSGADPVDVLVTFTNDLKTFVFTPVSRAAHSERALLGSALNNVPYRVYLCGTASRQGHCQGGGVKLSSGASAFQGHFRDYEWSFETGTFVDTTPPRIQSAIPVSDRGADGVLNETNCPTGSWHAQTKICDERDRPRNIMLQVTFNEAILPTVASGKTVIAPPVGATGAPPTPLSGVAGTLSVPTHGASIQPGSFQILRVSTPRPVDYKAGQWRLGNQYRTAEFTTEDLCGRNSCGQDVFCLPGLQNINLEVTAATLSPAGGPTSSGLFDGIEDVAGNSLDGNEDGLASGPQGFFRRGIDTPGGRSAPGDSVRSAFWTSDEIVLGAPVIELTSPTTTLNASTPVDSLTRPDGAPFTLQSPVEIIFDRAMAMTTLSSRTIDMNGTDTVTGGIWDSWWTLAAENLADDGAHPLGSTKAEVTHGGLWEKTDYKSAVYGNRLVPGTTPPEYVGAKDLYQNCYLPSAGGACTPTQAKPYCCNSVACQVGDNSCKPCGFY